MPNAQTGSRNLPSYSVDGDTVIDNVTHLVWQRGVGGAETLEAARQYCMGLSLTSSGPAMGFRAPTKIELESIIDETHWDPAWDSAVFQGSFMGLFWTVSMSLQTGALWHVDFSDGSSYASSDVKTLVRCVR